MDYVCDHMKRIVVYDQDRISITLTRCGECIVGGGKKIKS